MLLILFGGGLSAIIVVFGIVNLNNIYLQLKPQGRNRKSPVG